MATGVPPPTSCTGWMITHVDLPDTAHQTRYLVGYATQMASPEHPLLTNRIGAATLIALAAIRATGDAVQFTCMAIAECAACIIGTNFEDARAAIATHGKDALKSLCFVLIGTALAVATVFSPVILRGLTLSRTDAVTDAPVITRSKSASKTIHPTTTQFRWAYD